MSPAPRTASYEATGMYQSDRRVHQRYPISVEVEYELLDEGLQPMGLGRTINISSGGVLVDLSVPLPSRGSIQLSINWPFLLDGPTPLKFRATGNIIRHDGNRVAVQLTEHDFRTASHDRFKKRSRQ